VSEPGQHFSNFTFSGGIQNFGGKNTNTQHNHYGATPREQVEAQLAVLREVLPADAGADREITVIEGALANPTPEARGKLEAALKRLAENSGNARTAAEALTAIGALVAAHWPF